jgi:hypothetical protein
MSGWVSEFVSLSEFIEFKRLTRLVVKLNHEL